MDIATARKLCHSLVRRSLYGGIKLVANVVETGTELVAVMENDKFAWKYQPKARIVFSGAKSGEHSIDVYASDEARILAHWIGYCQNNGMHKPQVGQTVEFLSASNWQSGCIRRGRVLKLGPKRAVIAYTFKHGGKATITLPFSQVRFDPAVRRD